MGCKINKGLALPRSINLGGKIVLIIFVVYSCYCIRLIIDSKYSLTFEVSLYKKKKKHSI